jgi:hypothetical protein
LVVVLFVLAPFVARASVVRFAVGREGGERAADDQFRQDVRNLPVGFEIGFDVLPARCRWTSSEARSDLHIRRVSWSLICRTPARRPRPSRLRRRFLGSIGVPFLVVKRGAGEGVAQGG